MVEVEVDAERAGCFAERQLRFGLVVDGAVIKTSIQMGDLLVEGRKRAGGDDDELNINPPTPCQ